MENKNKYLKNNFYSQLQQAKYFFNKTIVIYF